jgi:membrane protein
VGAILAFVVIVLLAVVTPVVLQFVGLGDTVEALLAGLRWVVLWMLVVFGLSVIYRYAPDRRKPEWRWVAWGAAIAATLWIIGSLLFSLYVQNFGAYNETYGALGGVVVMLLWLYVSGFVVVLGAEINSELERQTTRDTTAGRPRRMGRRGAQAADTVGRNAEQAARRASR